MAELAFQGKAKLDVVRVRGGDVILEVALHASVDHAFVGVVGRREGGELMVTQFAGWGVTPKLMARIHRPQIILQMALCTGIHHSGVRVDDLRPESRGVAIVAHLGISP